MLPDERERFARALAVAANPVRPLRINVHIRGPTGALAFNLDHLIVTEDKPVLLPELRLTKSFPKIYADRAAGWGEIRKDDVVAYDDRRDQITVPAKTAAAPSLIATTTMSFTNKSNAMAQPTHK